MLSCGVLLATSTALAQVPAAVPTTSKVVTTAPAAPAATTAAPAPHAPAPPPSSVERARQGVVLLERQGKPLALGVVLEGDGRILTALSPLSTGNHLSARYHDGAVVPLKLSHSDRGWDLALLTPSTTAAAPLRKTGLRAAKMQSFVGLQTFTLGAPAQVVVAPAALRLAAELLGGDATSLSGAYELGGKVSYVGAPIVNDTGEVVALIARACPAKSAASCVPSPYGAPVAAIKQFLQKVPAEASWLGVETTLHDAGPVRGVRVVSVIPGSPAAIAGLRPGTNAAQADLIVAVDGTPVATPADLNEAVRARTAGDTIELLLYGLGRYRHVSVKPSPAPQLIQPPYTAPKPGKPRTPNPYR
jgi:S1-C subfamily serine protease